MIFDGLVANLRNPNKDKFLVYPIFLQIIFNQVLPNLPTIGTTHLLQDSNVYKRIAKLASTSNFNTNAEFDILPWLVDNNLEIMAVPESPHVTYEEEKESESDDDDDDSNDGGDGGDAGDDAGDGGGASTVVEEVVDVVA